MNSQNCVIFEKFVDFRQQNRIRLKDWYLNYRSEADLVDEDEDSIDLKCHNFRGNTDKCWCEQEKRRLAKNGIFIQSWIVEIKIGIPEGLKPSFAGQIEVTHFTNSIVSLTLIG